MSIDRATQPAGNAADPTVAYGRPAPAIPTQQSWEPQPAAHPGYAPGFGGPPGFAPPTPPAPSGGGRRGLIAAIIAGVVALAGIGAGVWFFLLAPSHVDPQAVTNEIVRVTQETEKAAPTGVQCPSDVVVARGATFTCTATLLNRPTTYTVTLTDEDGAFTIRYNRPVLDPASVQKEIVRITQSEVGLAPEAVKCPSDVKFQKGGTFDCTATLDKQPLTYRVTQTDDNGALTIAHSRVLSIKEINDNLSARLSRDVGEQVLAVCGAEGQTIVVNEPGDPITCGAANVADPTLSAQVKVTIDQSGTLAYDIQ